MTSTTIQQLTLQFYEWEKRGRGWHLFPNPVDIEPPFDAFTYHVQPKTFIDDGRVPTIFDSLKKIFGSNKEIEPQPNSDLVPIDYIPEGVLHVIAVSLPEKHKVEIEEAEQLLLMLSTCKNPVSFEICATGTTITIQFACREPDNFYVSSQLKAYFPECILNEENFDNELLLEDRETAILDLGLKEEFMRPLATIRDLSLDPLVGLFGVLDTLQPTDNAVIRWRRYWTSTDAPYTIIKKTAPYPIPSGTYRKHPVKHVMPPAAIPQSG